MKNKSKLPCRDTVVRKKNGKDTSRTLLIQEKEDKADLHRAEKNESGAALFPIARVNAPD